MTHTIHTALVQAPSHKMRQSQIFKLCKPGLDKEGLTSNNFYRLAASIPWIIIEKEGRNVISFSVSTKPQIPQKAKYLCTMRYITHFSAHIML